MLRLTRINHKPIVINAELIEHMEGTPDTVITMTGGQKFVVLETTGEVIDRVIEYRRLVNGPRPGLDEGGNPSAPIRARQDANGR
ncbi:MAG: flagellar FlbD family protein [Bryobacteraceae bacterium]